MMRFGLAFLAMLLAACLAQDAKAFDLSDDLAITGYGDVRAVIAPDPQSWLYGGLGKFRYGSKQKFGTEGVAQADLTLDEGLHAVGLSAPSRKRAAWPMHWKCICAMPPPAPAMCPGR